MRRRISLRGCVRPSVRPSVRSSVRRSVVPSVPRYFQTRTRRILCRVSGLVLSFFLFFVNFSHHFALSLSLLLFVMSFSPSLVLHIFRDALFISGNPRPSSIPLFLAHLFYSSLSLCLPVIPFAHPCPFLFLFFRLPLPPPAYFSSSVFFALLTLPDDHNDFPNAKIPSVTIS